MSTETRDALRDEDVARLFHETYERLAPLFGYETRRDSAVPWDQVPEQNRRLMVAVAGEVVAALRATETRDHWSIWDRETRNLITWHHSEEEANQQAADFYRAYPSAKPGEFIVTADGPQECDSTCEP